jgi:hypothetical protein
MLDKPEKTHQLLAALRAAVPFEVELTPSVIAHLRVLIPGEAAHHNEVIAPTVTE